VPEEWVHVAARGRPEDAARTIARELELGCHSVILHGAEPHEIAPMVEAYRAVRPELKRPVATNPGLFAS
jgi:5,10-methylenetetrahydromethanopterin reductase